MYQDYFLSPPTHSEINICTAVARRYARMSSTPTLQGGGDRLRHKWCFVEKHDTFSAEMLVVAEARSQSTTLGVICDLTHGLETCHVALLGDHCKRAKIKAIKVSLCY